ncbi:Lipoprotein YlpA precursor [Piscirickettsiaceae bacterium NZ-RLO1]|nr:Lipoprotein YlpA precursor [Piscirickettsiaceae bacterium NZ-RLO1]
MVQVNVLQVGEAPNVQSVWQTMATGYGSVMMGGFTGVAAGLATGSAGAGLAVGGATAAASWLADTLVKDVTYSMITDVQVSVKTDGKITQTTKSNLSQGTESTTTQTYSQKTHWLRYKTRRKRRYLGRYFAHPMMQNRRAKRDDYKPSAALVTGHYVP